MKDLKEKIVSGLLVGVCVIGMSNTSYAMEAGKKILTKTYECLSDSDTGEGQFEQQIEEDGHIYRLKNINVTILEKKLIEPMQYESPFFVDDPAAHYPDEVMDFSGEKYVLADTKLKASHQEARSEYKDSTIIVDKEYVDTLRSVESIEIVDEYSGESTVGNMSLIESTVLEEYWDGDFTFPIVISDYDAEEYMLGEVRVSQDADLNDYKAEFLAYLGLPETEYRIEEIAWDGAAYDEGGVVKRKANAFGSKKIQKISAQYGGMVDFEERDGNIYESTYRKMTDKEIKAGHPIEGEGYLYVMRADAEYEQEASSLLDLFKEIWERIMIWIREHPVEVVCLMLLGLVIILLWIFTKKRKRENRSAEDDERLLQEAGILPKKKKW